MESPDVAAALIASLDLRDTVELIDSRIHQRGHSQQRHKADSSDWASFTSIWFDQNFIMSCINIVLTEMRFYLKEYNFALLCLHIREL